MARPDIAIGDHPDLGIVANTATGIPAATILLARLGFVRDAATGLYVLPSDEPGRPNTQTARAVHAVSVLRGAHFHVDADIAYEPGTTPVRPRPAEPDVAFGLHPEYGVAAAITGERPYAAMILRAAGFTRDAERDVYLLPAGLSHDAASTIARSTTSVLRRSGATVHVLPGALAAPVATGQRGTRIARLIEGPHGARSMLESLRRFVQTATAWCAERTGGGATFAADRLTSAAARLDVSAQSLDNAARRLRTTDGHGPATAQTALAPAPAETAAAAKTADVPLALDKLAADLRATADDPTAAAVLAQVVAKDGPLDQLQRIVAAAAQQSAHLPQQTTGEIAEPLVDAVVHLNHVSDTLAELGARLASNTAPAAATPARADAASAVAEDGPGQPPQQGTERTSRSDAAAQAARATPARPTKKNSAVAAERPRAVPGDTPAVAAPSTSAGPRR